MANINMIFSCNEKGAIGYNNQLLFSIKKDMEYFKDKTIGNTVIMGRKTLESLPGDMSKNGFPDRENIVLTTNSNIRNTGEYGYNVKFCSYENLTNIINNSQNDKTYWIVGGESIYNLFMPLADKIYMTYVLSNEVNYDRRIDIDYLKDNFDCVYSSELKEGINRLNNKRVLYQFKVFNRRQNKKEQNNSTPRVKYGKDQKVIITKKKQGLFSENLRNTFLTIDQVTHNEDGGLRYTIKEDITKTLLKGNNFIQVFSQDNKKIYLEALRIRGLKTGDIVQYNDGLKGIVFNDIVLTTDGKWQPVSDILKKRKISKISLVENITQGEGAYSYSQYLFLDRQFFDMNNLYDIVSSKKNKLRRGLLLKDYWVVKVNTDPNKPTEGEEYIYHDKYGTPKIGDMVIVKDLSYNSNKRGKHKKFGRIINTYHRKLTIKSASMDWGYASKIL